MKYVTGNLLDMFDQGKFDIIIHGCNCFCAMGGGIAKQIADRYPEALIADKETTPGDYHKMGSYSFAELPGNRAIINGYTQFAYGKTEVYTNYQSVYFLFKKLRCIRNDVRIGIPKIGAGLGGGDWKVIEGIIDEVMEGKDITCVIYEK